MTEPRGPEIILNCKDDKYILTRHNTGLYTFWGKLANYNHIYFEFPVLNDTSDDETGVAYIFAHETGYAPVKELIEAYDFPQYLNLTSLEPEEMAAYNENMAKNFASITEGLSIDPTDM